MMKEGAKEYMQSLERAAGHRAVKATPAFLANVGIQIETLPPQKRREVIEH